MNHVLNQTWTFLREDCQTFGRIQDGWWPGVLDLRYLRRLTSRLSRWLSAAQGGIRCVG